MYYVLGILVFFLVLQTVVARLEKRMVWPYGPPQAQPPFSDESGYGDRWVEDALQAGFSLSGWAPDLKGPRYQVSYGLLASREGDCFAIIGVGKILTMTLRGTWLYTRATDGRVFYTTDNQSCVEIDVSRKWRSQLAKVDTFSKLLQRHRDWLRDQNVTAHSFSVGREVEEYKGVREERFQAMSRLGLISFTDASATHWRYTFYGALKLAVLNYSIGLLRAITGGHIPRSA